MTIAASDNVLIISPGPIAGSVQSMPALQLYRQEHPESEITVLATAETESLWRMHAAPDGVLIQDGVARTVRGLKKRAFHQVYDLSGMFLSAWIPFAAGVPHRTGAMDSRGRLLATRRVRTGNGQRTFHYMTLLGVQGEPPPPQVTPPLESRRSLERKLHHLPDFGRSLPAFLQALDAERPEGGHPVVTLQPPAGLSSWSLSGLIQRLRSELNALLFLDGPAAMSAACGEIAASAGGGVLNTAGRLTLQERAVLFSISRCVISDDGDASRLAEAVGTAVAALCDAGAAGCPRRQGMFRRKARNDGHALAGIHPDTVLDAVRGCLRADPPGN